MANLATLQARYTEVDTAISELVSGGVDEYEVNGQKVKRIDLDKLIKWRSQLAAEINQATRGGPFSLARHRRTT